MKERGQTTELLVVRTLETLENVLKNLPIIFLQYTELLAPQRSVLDY